MLSGMLERLGNLETIAERLQRNEEDKILKDVQAEEEHEEEERVKGRAEYIPENYVDVPSAGKTTIKQDVVVGNTISPVTAAIKTVIIPKKVMMCFM